MELVIIKDLEVIRSIRRVIKPNSMGSFGIVRFFRITVTYLNIVLGLATNFLSIWIFEGKIYLSPKTQPSRVDINQIQKNETWQKKTKLDICMGITEQYRQNVLILYLSN